MTLDVISEHSAFDGKVGFYRHRSEANQCTMQFAVFQPPQAATGPVPVVTWLAGLTCSEETFMIKGGALRVAAELGLMLVAPDTSPRGDDVPDDPEGAYDFGLGAGFYVNASEAPWNRHYNMYDYVTQELREIVAGEFPSDRQRQGIFGHSMGGHGALTLGLRNPGIFSSISAFAPICSPIHCPWGQKALGNYLGSEQTKWSQYDATELARSVGDSRPAHPILVDQGLGDQFLEVELNPQMLQEACRDGGIELELRRHPGYDHGYYFISTFMEDHLRHHAKYLRD
ncbi:MAG: S-formylglutathione hydrolase [Gammaproteobacteria bacterium]|nr:S-formylglutathione hydrolase [Gammaproteobacteria bacterium]